jgi:hypothetical protein
MLALLHVPRELFRDPPFERPAQPCWDKLILSIAVGALSFLIVVRVLLSLQSLCLPIQGEGKANPSSCSVSNTL